MSRAAAALVALAASLVPAGSAVAQSAPDAGAAFEPTPLTQPLYRVQHPAEDPARQRHVVEASDGTELFVETWLPKAKDGNVPPERVPTVLVLSPYHVKGAPRYSSVYFLVPGRAEPGHPVQLFENLVPYGYALAQAHVRGTGASGGCTELLSEQEADDGARIIEYLGRDAPWSNGAVGGFGVSYEGGALLSTAALGDPDRTQYLKAIVPVAPSPSWYDFTFQDGVPNFAMAPGSQVFYLLLTSLLFSNASDSQAPLGYPDRMSCQGEVATGVGNLSGDVTPFFKERDARRGIENIGAATLMAHGHPDPRVSPLVQAGLFDRLPDSTPRASVFGVWGHETPNAHYIDGFRKEWERADFMPMVRAWFDRYLLALPTGVEEWPRVQVQGTDGQWRAEPDWPFTGGPVGRLHLSEGALGASEPTGASSYVEGALETTETEHPPGTAVVFETPALPGRLELTGQPVLEAWVSLDRPDAHLAAKLEAFDADGREIPYARTTGLRSMQHVDPLVDGRFDQGSGRLPPIGAPVQVSLRFRPTDIVVPEGGRLRLTIAGSMIVFDGLDAFNQNAGVLLQGPSQPSGTATRVTVHHDCAHPSALRFEMPREDAELLNVREKDEPAGTPLADDPEAPAPESDGGGIATAEVCCGVSPPAGSAVPPARAGGRPVLGSGRASRRCCQCASRPSSG